MRKIKDDYLKCKRKAEAVPIMNLAEIGLFYVRDSLLTLSYFLV